MNRTAGVAAMLIAGLLVAGCGPEPPIGTGPPEPVPSQPQESQPEDVGVLMASADRPWASEVDDALLADEAQWSDWVASLPDEIDTELSHYLTALDLTDAFAVVGPVGGCQNSRLTHTSDAITLVVTTDGAPQCSHPDTLEVWRVGLDEVGGQMPGTLARENSDDDDDDGSVAIASEPVLESQEDWASGLATMAPVIAHDQIALESWIATVAAADTAVRDTGTFNTGTFDAVRAVDLRTNVLVAAALPECAQGLQVRASYADTELSAWPQPGDCASNDDDGEPASVHVVAVPRLALGNTWGYTLAGAIDPDQPIMDLRDPIPGDARLVSRNVEPDGGSEENAVASVSERDGAVLVSVSYTGCQTISRVVVDRSGSSPALTPQILDLEAECEVMMSFSDVWPINVPDSADVELGDVEYLRPYADH